MTIVNVKWYGAYDLDTMDSKAVSLSKGIYAIYRVYGGKETLIYIGKTTRSFQQRFYEHKRDWLWSIRGVIKVRLGILEYPEGQKYSKQKLADVESLLIIWHDPPYNTTSHVYYRGRFDLEIINSGRRGLIDKNIHVDSLAWA